MPDVRVWLLLGIPIAQPEVIAMRRWFAVFALLSMLTAGFHSAATPEPAEAAGIGCADNDRALASRIASSGQFIEPLTVYSRYEGVARGKITLRYSAAYNCVWAIMERANNRDPMSSMLRLNVWMDREHRYGGRFESGKRQWFDSITHTGTYTMNFYGRVRACGFTEFIYPDFSPGVLNKDAVACTNWFYPSRLCCNQHVGGQQFDRITSPDGRYVLVMQSDGNLVQYEYATARAMWVRGRAIPGTILRMQSDGNLVLIAPGNIPIWQAGTGGRGGPDAFLQLQDDGNLVIYGNTGATWANHAR